MSLRKSSLSLVFCLTLWCSIASIWPSRSYAAWHYQTTPPLTPVTAENGAASDQFGYAVVVDAGTIVVGADKADANGNRSGTAYIYTETTAGWTQQAQLIVDDLHPSARFGAAVDVANDTVVIGAYQDEGPDYPAPGVGSTHIFVRSGSTWTHQARLDSMLETGGWFGYAVGIDNETVIVGAPTETHNEVSTGAAYVFTRSGTTWTQEALLVGDDLTDGALFGTAVAVSQNTVVIGARNQKAAYVFTRSGTAWSQQAKLTGDGQGGNSLFGVAVALDGDTILVGDHWYDAGKGANQGTVYVFARTGTTWTQQQKLTAGSAAQDDWFGLKVDISGDQSMIGAPGRVSGENFQQGAAFLFEKSGEIWVEQQEWTLADGAAEDNFGGAVGVDDGAVAIGAPFRDIEENRDQGGLYVVQLPKRQTITFAALPNRLVSDKPFTLTATASSGLPIAYSTTTPEVCSITDAVVTLLSAGECTITAAQPGDDEYPAAPAVTRSFTVITPVTVVHLPLIYRGEPTH